jgi:mono/diheme cytochrome c family protein
VTKEAVIVKRRESLQPECANTTVGGGPTDSRIYITTGGFMLRTVICLAILSVAGAASAAAQDAKTEGEKVFAAQKCGLCHSVGGKGNPKGPLEEGVSKLSADEIRSWITDANGMTAKTKATRKPAMKQVTLPKEDVDALVAYLSALKKK